jgi:hypothetical protein
MFFPKCAPNGILGIEGTHFYLWGHLKDNVYENNPQQLVN